MAVAVAVTVSTATATAAATANSLTILNEKYFHKPPGILQSFFHG